MGLKLSAGAVLGVFWAVGGVRSGCGSCAPIGGVVADEDGGEGKDGRGCLKAVKWTVKWGRGEGGRRGSKGVLKGMPYDVRFVLKMGLDT